MAAPGTLFPRILLTFLATGLAFAIGYVLMHPKSDPQPEDLVLRPRVAELEAQVAQLQARVAELSAEDEVFADFEGADYGDWTIEGKAFGKAPARGTLDNQNAVSGFLGSGLVNTYLGGSDALTGTLTSPDFTLDRAFICLLVGGGNHPETACVKLILEDGTVARSATGKDDEHLEWVCWNVAAWKGKKARIQIIDQDAGGWGHINVDQITLTQHPK